MKYLKKYNENIESKYLSEDDIKNLFIHTIDNCNDFIIEKSYFSSEDPENWWYPEDGDEDPPEDSTKGYILYFKYEQIKNLTDFEKYKELINELNDDIFRFKGLNKNSEIYFSHFFTNVIGGEAITIGINLNIKI